MLKINFVFAQFIPVREIPQYQPAVSRDGSCSLFLKNDRFVLLMTKKTRKKEMIVFKNECFGNRSFFKIEKRRSYFSILVRRFVNLGRSFLVF